jgi:hypothetical protein
MVSAGTHRQKTPQRYQTESYKEGKREFPNRGKIIRGGIPIQLKAKRISFIPPEKKTLSGAFL